MLHTLRIQDLVIIEDLTVEFAPGLNLLTGETGAGKSILLTALGVATGQRMERDRIRRGAPRAVVEALFDVAPGAAVAGWLADHGFTDGGDGQLVIRRELPAEGAGRAFVNGSPATVALLRELGQWLLELHEQFEQQSLLAADRQLALLDRFGRHEPLVARVAAACAAVGAAHRRMAELARDDAARERRIADLEQCVRDIGGLRPVPGERDELERERRRLRNAGRMLELLDEVIAASCEGDPSAATLAAAAARRAEELAGLDEQLAEPAGRLRSAAIELGDAGTAFRDYRERSDFDPARLEALEVRRAAIERVCQRYGTDETGLLARASDAAAELETLADRAGSIAAAETALARAAADYGVAAIELGARRRAAAPELAALVSAQLAELGLGRARFEIAVSPAGGSLLDRADGEPIPLGPRGAERVDFVLAANPGERLARLSQAASGGELSRVMLALHVVVDGATDDRVLVFDEVDAGIGGAVADAVGGRLARLARRRQVLCVTHLPQVAAHADHHYRVSKSVTAGRTRAAIDRLSRDERVEEVARMLAGRRPTPSSRQHAAELLSAAGRRAPSAARRGA